jgi:hypothetical protein
VAPNTPFPTRAGAEQWRAAQATDVAILAGRQPVPEEAAPALSRGVLASLGYLVAIVLVLALALLLLFLFGEDRTRQVARPALTPAQRANAFRL